MQHTTPNNPVLACAEQNLRQQHDAALHNLHKRTAELADVARLLAPVLRSGHITLDRVRIGNDARDQIEIFTRSNTPATKYPQVMWLLNMAGLEAHAACGWQHPTGWRLYIAWADEHEAQHAAARFTEEGAGVPA